RRRGYTLRGATLYVTLEPCCTHGRTPPCTSAIIAAGIKRVIAGATDPNPKHAGKGFKILKRAGIHVVHGVLADDCAHLNEAFNHWIVHRTPFVTVKAAMTLDGKIATVNGESKWITGPQARAHGMYLRKGADAILAGINTIIADDPALTVRQKAEGRRRKAEKVIRRIILDPTARIPLTARVLNDELASSTIVVVTKAAPKPRVRALSKKANVIVAPVKSQTSNLKSQINLRWLLKRLGSENVTSLLVEGGGEANAAFLLGGFAHRIAFFYAPKMIGGRSARKAVGGTGIKDISRVPNLTNPQWKRLGKDLLLTAGLEPHL
ncbi:MAG TPA: bifunctional diaminohydroxyphosphoribosylaminopyrimidine deaminase/5-amino-6-(5-phosphoribosylamino)uracil reductase RibD, partial [Desulfuromonadaceae bacterium]|nr:bifunctional diaminohydroxyphosphoribosylaminopyrimidine deaminase/5-amino-6-(5-phosphoribosylamino)uracil reductase RibD [Desulfuromonadaceae bacterium]